MNSNYLAVRTITFVLVMLVALQTKAQLVINEISQGEKYHCYRQLPNFVNLPY